MGGTPEGEAGRGDEVGGPPTSSTTVNKNQGKNKSPEMSGEMLRKLSVERSNHI